MTNNFVYVFSKHDRDVLLTFGFYLVYANDVSEVYGFVNNCEMKFALDGIKYLPANTLLFGGKIPEVTGNG